MLELQNAINALSMPLGTALVLSLTALAAAVLQRRRAALILALISAGWLWLCSTPDRAGSW
jgi:hypothetical protein